MDDMFKLFISCMRIDLNHSADKKNSFESYNRESSSYQLDRHMSNTLLSEQISTDLYALVTITPR